MSTGDINYVYLCSLKPILNRLKRVYKPLTKMMYVDSDRLSNDSKRALESSFQKISVPISIFKLFEDNIEPLTDHNCYLKLCRMKGKVFKGELLLRDQSINFLISLVREITQRLPENVNVLKQFLSRSVENNLRVVKPHFIRFLHYFNDNLELMDSNQNQ